MLGFEVNTEVIIGSHRRLVEELIRRAEALQGECKLAASPVVGVN